MDNRVRGVVIELQCDAWSRDTLLTPDVAMAELTGLRTDLLDLSALDASSFTFFENFGNLQSELSVPNFGFLAWLGTWLRQTNSFLAGGTFLFDVGSARVLNLTVSGDQAMFRLLVPEPADRINSIFDDCNRLDGVIYKSPREGLAECDGSDSILVEIGMQMGKACDEITHQAQSFKRLLDELTPEIRSNQTAVEVYPNLLAQFDWFMDNFEVDLRAAREALSRY